jgi:peptidoglycan/xylan/chitin deacetylase (PgdA/CDA1 family)
MPRVNLPSRAIVGVSVLVISGGCGASPAGPVAAPQVTGDVTPSALAEPTAAGAPSPAATTPGPALGEVPIAAAAPKDARLVINVPAYDSPGARVPLILTLLRAPDGLAPEALTATASGGARVVECGPSWRNPEFRSVSRACHLLTPTSVGSTTVTAEAVWRTRAGARQSVRATPSTLRTKGPRSAPVSAADAERIARCGNTSDDVWLTFDDYVPSMEVARGMLAVLERNGVRGRFFLNRVTPAIREALESAGHVVTNHTRDHAALSDLSDSGIAEQVRGGPATTRGETKLLRPPYGAGAWSTRVVDAVAAAGHATCRWTVDTADYAGRSAERMAGVVRWGDFYSPPVGPGGVLLMHANHFSAAKLQAVIDAVRARGLEPEPNPFFGHTPRPSR